MGGGGRASVTPDARRPTPPQRRAQCAAAGGKWGRRSSCACASDRGRVVDYAAYRAGTSALVVSASPTHTESAPLLYRHRCAAHYSRETAHNGTRGTSLRPPLSSVALARVC
eukprot:scaffold6986_cov317-Prasinococcus_capsulatus_cf.AAC.1